MAARALSLGRNPYGSYVDLVPATWEAPLNLSAPISLLFYAPLVRIDPLIALWLARFASTALYVGIVLWLAHASRSSPLRLLWAFALFGFWETLMAGQIYVLLLVLVAGAFWREQRGDYVGAGVCIGLLAAIKPNFLVWPVLLLAARHQRLARSSLLSFGFFAVLPIIAYGPLVYVEWLQASRLVADASTTDVYYYVNVSLMGVTGRLGSIDVGMVLTALLLAALALWAWAKRPEATVLGGVSIIATLIAGPTAAVGYTILLLPAFLARRWDYPTIVGAALISMPLTTILSAVMYWTLGRIDLIGTTYTAALGLMLISVLVSRHSSTFAESVVFEYLDGSSASVSSS